MPPVRLTRLDDPRVELFAGVSDPALLRRHRLFVAEGRFVVERLLDAGRYRVRSLLLNEPSYESLAPRLEALAPEIEVFVCGSADFTSITGFNLHRGCLALAERPRPLLVEQVLGEGRLFVVLERITDADNVGSIFRNAAAFGVDAVLLSATCCDPLYRKAIRTSMGASLNVPFARVMHWERGLDLLRGRGVARVALTPAASAQPLADFCRRRPEKLALLVGTEGAGLTAETLAHADYTVRIPIEPAVDSLNVAVATGIALARLRD